jgi:hypothetical protein
VTRRRHAGAVRLLGALLVGAAACGHAPSPPDMTVRADLRVPVEVNGTERAPIDPAMLRRVKPDYVQGERRAWRFATLLGPEFERQDAGLEIENARGLKTSIAPPTRQIDGRIAVLALNRKGDLVVAMVPPDDPFPKFHGRGGNRGRSGDPARVTRDIKRIRLTYGPNPGAGESASAVPGVALRVVVDDRPPVVWTRADLEKVPRLAAAAGARDDALPQWSLREIVTHLVDANAIAVELTGEGNVALAIDPTLWRDTTKVPVLRFNRRGLLKFEWATTSLVPTGAAEVRGVTAVRVSIPGH